MIPTTGYVAETTCRPSDDCALCREGLRRISETEVSPIHGTVRRLLHLKDGALVLCEDQLLVKLSWGGKPRG